MKNCLLSIPERIFVEEARANTTDKLAYMKLSVLVMLDEGFTQELVSVALGIGLGTVNKCKKKYDSDGLDSFLDRHYVPYQGKLDDAQLALLDAEIEQGVYSTCSEVLDWVEKNFGISYTESGIRAILTKLGFVYKKTVSVPGGADIAEQERFLKQLEPFLEEIDTETEVVCFMDAVHPQHNTRSDYVWAKQGQDKEVRTNSGRNRVNINGAMNAHRPEEVVMVEAERINAESTRELFEKLLHKYQDKAKIYILADNARYYYNETLRKWLEENPKIQMLHLPPYSPNLNLIERLWKFLRKKVINLHFYATFDEFRKAIREFFENLKQYKDELKTLMRPNFQRFAAPPGTMPLFS
jgi:transposase